MSLQQSTQPKSYANGFGRRRAEREGGTRLDNKLQSGKSNLNRSSNSGAGVGGKVGCGSPRDRLIYLSTCLIGHLVEVHLKNGSIYSGTCYTTNVEKEFSIVLRMARLIKDVPFRGQKAETLSKAPSKTFIIHGREVAQLIAKDVSVTMDGMNRDFQNEKQQEIIIDSLISQSRHSEFERELGRWVPDEDAPQCPELENIFDAPWNSWGWDQFETNEMLFGVKSTFDEELYTTKLERGPQTRELEKEAMRIAREIEGEDTQDLHLAEERGIHLHENFDIDEETRFSSVYRGTRADDSGYEETEDILLDSRNSETFGDAPASYSTKSMDLAHGKSDDRSQVLSSSSLDEAQCSQSCGNADLYHSVTHEQARQLASELPSKNLSTSESESRIIENLCGEHGANDSNKEFVEEQAQAEGAQLPTRDDSQSPLNGKKDSCDKGGLSPNATAFAPPSNVTSNSNEKTSSSAELPEGAPSVKGAGEVQAVNSRGRPGSSTSSNSDCVGAVSVSNGPGLSPSSSMGSLSSEKSTLNPHAKEFKLNPNAKSFTPSQTPVRPPSPASDGSFYFQPNVPALPHMHGMPMGIGIGHSFTGHQPVIFNPQVASLQTQQAYFHPGGPQYGQQMLVGHPRQVLYMPSYQPMPYKGREF
ncbi:polyadenylate-binding protein-interacting protein 3 isoform X3 [Jatropha curcas]|uniref:polyadenylate-binding protein-interacting protein 3 isoform X3 n=1 Tax=Jatropha curcas TaxID=180498 RepID=UPI0009D7410E|nr:polyadenylate-binding protein-interacting protein 3 isoform X3 [Jatropha curcas]